VFARRGEAPRSDRRWLAAIMAVAFFFAAVGFGTGWRTRGEQTLSSANARSDRLDLTRAAVRIIKKHPLLGVGPGEYTISLGDVAPEFRLPVHNVVLLEAAESGVFAGLFTTALLVALAWRAARGG